MKEFVIYTGLRAVIFVATAAVVAGIWSAIAGSFPWFPVLVIALLVSGLASWFVLNRQRGAFAARVEQRAAKAAQAFEARRAKEDS